MSLRLSRAPCHRNLSILIPPPTFCWRSPAGEVPWLAMCWLGIALPSAAAAKLLAGGKPGRDQLQPELAPGNPGLGALPPALRGPAPGGPYRPAEEPAIFGLPSLSVKSKYRPGEKHFNALTGSKPQLCSAQLCSVGSSANGLLQMVCATDLDMALSSTLRVCGTVRLIGPGTSVPQRARILLPSLL